MNVQDIVQKHLQIIFAFYGKHAINYLRLWGFLWSGTHALPFKINVSDKEKQILVEVLTP